MMRPVPMRGPGMSPSPRTVVASPAGGPVPATRPATAEERAALRDIAAVMGAAVKEAEAATPADPLGSAQPGRTTR